MEEHRKFSEQEAREIGERIGIDWDTARFDVEQFRIGLAVELEHGRRDSATNVSDDDEITTGKIAWAHLNEFPTTTRAWRRWKPRPSGTGPSAAATEPGFFRHLTAGAADAARLPGHEA